MFLNDTNLGRLILGELHQEKTAGSTTGKSADVSEARKISSGLNKVAGLTLREEAHDSIKEMMKMASECITDLVNSLESVEDRNSGLEKAAGIRILIDDMINRGQVDEYNAKEKIAELMSKDDNQILIIKEAMKMIENGKEGNIFFELDKEAAAEEGSKLGMFGNILPS